jgi:F-type H+-transporting ATPase subunit alpha
LVEILKQPQYNPLPVEKQVLLIYAGTNGYLDPIPVSDVGAYEAELYRTFELRHAGILTTIADKKQIDDETKGLVNAALKEFSQQFAARKAA